MAPVLSDDDKFKLIELVHQHSCIWESTTLEYLNRDQAAGSFLAIAKAMGNGMTDKDVRRALHSLRSMYSNNLAKLNSSADDAGAPRWKFFQALDFLRPHTRVRKKTTGGKPHGSPAPTQNDASLQEESSNESEDGTFKRHKCDLCEIAFALPRVLETHQMIEHKIKAAWTCGVCGMPFLQSTSYSTHVLSRHNISPFVCDECGEGFATSYYLKKHQRKHKEEAKTDEKPTYKCEQCPKEFIHPCKLRVHQRRHTGEKPFVCKLCNQAFLTSCQRFKHIERVHIAVRKYLCQVCGMKFKAQRELNEHSRTHTGERPFVCKVCSRSFSKRNALAVHGRQHTGEKPYVCDQCGHAFTVRISLRTHLTSKHNVPDIKLASCNLEDRSSPGDNTLPRVGRPKRSQALEAIALRGNSTDSGSDNVGSATASAIASAASASNSTNAGSMKPVVHAGTGTINSTKTGMKEEINTASDISASSFSEWVSPSSFQE